MKTAHWGMKVLGLVAAGVLAFGILSACTTKTESGASSSASTGAPQIAAAIAFDIVEPVTVSEADKDRFLRALNKYSDPDATLIKQRGEVIWPPDGFKIRTDRVVEDSEEKRPLGDVHFPRATHWVVRPHAVRAAEHTYWRQHTRGAPYAAKDTRGVLHTAKDTRGVLHTAKDTRGVHAAKDTYRKGQLKVTYVDPEKFTGAVRSTQYLGFRTEEDMQAFLRALSK